MKDANAQSDVIRLRPMQSADLSTFLLLGSETCGSLHGRPNLTKSELFNKFQGFVKEFAFRPESEIWVAHSDLSDYAGHLWLYVTANRFNGNNELWIWDVSVMSEFRGRGIGKILIEYAKKRASELKCAELWLLVAEDNEIAISLYSSTGFSSRAQMLAIDL